MSLSHFSALTASKHLTRLVLEANNYHPQPLLPLGALQHVFPAGRQLPQLKKLRLSGPRPCDSSGQHECATAAAGGKGADGGVDWSPHSIGGQDLAHIFSCCPRLESLTLSNEIVQPGADLSALSRLPVSCRELRIGGEAFSHAAAPIIAQLTHLTSLEWSASPGLTECGLSILTPGLCNLQVLDVHGCSLSPRFLGLNRFAGDDAGHFADNTWLHLEQQGPYGVSVCLLL